MRPTNCGALVECVEIVDARDDRLRFGCRKAGITEWKQRPDKGRERRRCSSPCDAPQRNPAKKSDRRGGCRAETTNLERCHDWRLALSAAHGREFAKATTESSPHTEPAVAPDVIESLEDPRAVANLCFVLTGQDNETRGRAVSDRSGQDDNDAEDSDQVSPEQKTRHPALAWSIVQLLRRGRKTKKSGVAACLLRSDARTGVGTRARLTNTSRRRARQLRPKRSERRIANTTENNQHVQTRESRARG